MAHPSSLPPLEDEGDRSDRRRSTRGSALAAYLKTPVWAVGADAAPTGGLAPDTDIVLSARARLARNLAGYAFPHRASERDLRRVAQEVRRAALADTERLGDLVAVSLSNLAASERGELVDARRISPELAEVGASRYALLDEVGLLSVFVNEEDHVRIQALTPGNAPLVALRSAEDADTRLARRLVWARDPAQWGYLTSSLGNMGTGLRLSVLVHLPGLAFLERLSRTLEAAHVLGISIRGAHGERSAAVGDLYQVSNAITVAPSASHIAGRVRPVADYLVAAERAARVEVAETQATRLVVAARAAWKRIEDADRLDASEALRLLSVLRLAAAAGLAPMGGAAPDAALFATLVADLRTGAGLTGGVHAVRRSPLSVRDAIQRPARIRSALRRFYGRTS